MASKTRRTLEELLVRYELHPDVCDIYVEGETDKDLLRWFFETSGRRRVMVYPITEVDIPVREVERYKAANNNRGRVTLLAEHLSKNLTRMPKVSCVIDADLDYVLGVPAPSGMLLRTDYSSMDMYAFDESAVHKAARLLGCELDKTGKEILDEISGFLTRLFEHRIVNHVLELRLQWVDAHKCCTITASKISFDEVEFRRRYLNRKGLTASERVAFENQLKQNDLSDIGDIRLVIRGHDFLETLAWYFSEHISRPPHPDATLVRRLLFASLSFDGLSRQRLFSTLLERTRAC